MIALGQPTASALVAAFTVWCLKVLDKPRDEVQKARVVVEGLVGAGKSTIVRKVGGRCESTDAWAPYLEWESRQNPGRILCRQIRILSDYVTGSTAPRLEERSWASALMFTSMLLSSFDKRYAASYVAMLKSAVRSRAVMLPNVVVYLNRTPEVCYERTQIREQPGDKVVTLAYLQRLEAAHAMLMKFYLELGVHVVDAKDMTDDEVVECCREHMDFSAEDDFDVSDVLKAIDRWFGVQSEDGL